MAWARDKIRRPNQTDTSGNSRRQARKGQAEEELEWQHRGVDRQILRRDTSHGTQPAGVERADEEVHHDAPLRLPAELRDQGKALKHSTIHITYRSAIIASVVTIQKLATYLYQSVSIVIIAQTDKSCCMPQSTSSLNTIQQSHSIYFICIFFISAKLNSNLTKSHHAFRRKHYPDIVPGFIFTGMSTEIKSKQDECDCHKNLYGHSSSRWTLLSRQGVSTMVAYYLRLPMSHAPHIISIPHMAL